MSRSNYDKPFYVDIGTSIVAIRCASNHDIVVWYDYVLHPHTLELAEHACNRMNEEAEIGRPLRNCDVGTAEEQYKRFDKICSAKQPTKDCPLFEKTAPCCSPFCFARWAQMPYKDRGV